MALKARDKGIEFELRVLSSIPDLICSDPTRLRQILNNVVGNAIKFTDRGHVAMAVSYADHMLEFTVRDTGPGISEEQAAILFQPFHQGDVSTTRKFGGTGLGLVLTRRLADAMGGTFILEKSNLGEGSTFSVRIKIVLSKQHSLVAIPSLASGTKSVHQDAHSAIEPLAGMRILVVEDSPDNQMLLKRVLMRAGADVDVASDGSEGVQCALTHNYNVVLMDLQMPRMDGYEAAGLLRDKNYSRPIVALTAHAMKEERDRAVRAGFSEFLSKPVQSEALIEMILSFNPTEKPKHRLEPPQGPI